MNNKRITKAMKFAAIKALLLGDKPEINFSTEDAFAFIDAEVALLTKKNANDRKPTPQQVENESVKDAIRAAVNAEPARMFTITEWLNSLDLPVGMTNQRLSAIVRQMLPDTGSGEVERVVDKRKTYFRKAQ